jgi:hypothetical protein
MPTTTSKLPVTICLAESQLDYLAYPYQTETQAIVLVTFDDVFLSETLLYHAFELIFPTNLVLVQSQCYNLPFALKTSQNRYHVRNFSE